MEELELSSREADELPGKEESLDDGELPALAELLPVAELSALPESFSVAELSTVPEPSPPLLSEEISSDEGSVALLLSSQAVSVKNADSCKREAFTSGIIKPRSDQV